MTDWPIKTLGEVAFVGAGNSAPQDKELFKSGKHRFVRTSDVGQIRIGRLGQSVDLLNDAGIEGLREFRAGVTLLPKSGASTFLNHRVQLTKPCFVSSHLAVVDPNPEVMDDSFMFYFLQTVRSQDLIQDQSYPSLNLNSISGIHVLVPPLAEQKRIVALLDDATAHITELSACYEQAFAQANDLLESSLMELFAGAFESHPKRKMGEILQIARGGSPRPISEYITKSPKGVNWIKIGDASASKKYIFETAEKIKPEGVSRSRMVYPGDFLLSNSMSFGRPYIMKTEGCIHDGWLVLRDSKGELDQDFLFHLLGSRFMYERFSQLAAGSTVQNLNSSLVSSVEIPVPPLDFQKELATKAIEIEERVSQLRENFELKLQTMDELKQAILEAAFAGEL
jgi:type I restriction enzyme S subunit